MKYLVVLKSLFCNFLLHAIFSCRPAMLATFFSLLHYSTLMTFLKRKGFIISVLIICFIFIYDIKSYSQHSADYATGVFLAAGEPFFPDMRFSTTGSNNSPHLILSWPLHFIFHDNYSTFESVFFEPQWSHSQHSKAFLTGIRLWHLYGYGNFNQGIFVIEVGGFISNDSGKGGFAGIGTGIGEFNALVFRGYKSQKEMKFDVSFDFFFLVR